MQYTIVGSEDGTSNVTVFVPGRAPMVAHSSHPNFERIVEGVTAGDESVADLFDIAQTASSKFERLTDRVTTANGRLYLDNEEVDNALATQVVRFLSEGVEDWKPLVRFFENVQMNPNEHSREQLYDWLNKRDFTITDSGMIVGYKGVQKNGEDLVSVFTGRAIVDGETKNGHIPNYIGAVVEMPRGEVTHDPATGCSTGLHVGTYDFAKSYAHGAMLEVHVHPRDVVSVPTECDWAKMRVCRYTVVDTIDAPHTTPVLDTGYEDEEEWGEDFWGDREFDEIEEPIVPEPITQPNAATYLLDEVVVNVGDVYQDLDPRRVGRTVTVESIEGDKAVVKSLPSNVTVKVGLDRLKQEYRFRKV